MSSDGRRATVRQRVRIVGYTLGAALVLGMYLIVPVLLALQSRVPALSARMLIAVGLLAAVEAPVIRVLIQTTRAHHPDVPTPVAPTRHDEEVGDKGGRSGDSGVLGTQRAQVGALVVVPSWSRRLAGVLLVLCGFVLVLLRCRRR